MRLYLWQSYFLRELGKSLLFTLIAFYGLYIIIDSANQMGSWRHHQFSIGWQQWCWYYVCEFLYRADVLLPFAFLLASLRTLITLNGQGELTALLCSGISMKRLLHPFLACALLITGLLYLNGEYGMPTAIRTLKTWQGLKNKRPLHNDSVQEIALSDSSRLLYREYDADNHRFNDLFWIKSGDHIIRMRYLFNTEPTPRATWVEELQRTESGELEVVAIAEERLFPSLQHEEKSWRTAAVNAEQASLMTLWQQMTKDKGTYSYREAQFATAFYQRITLPWLCLLAIMIAAPYCMRKSRHIPTFLLYAVALFSLVAVYMLLDAMAVMGRRQIVDPAWALLMPMTVTCLLAGYHYSKLR
jgi:lipopolysaccharide export system permease protein